MTPPWPAAPVRWERLTLSVIATLATLLVVSGLVMPVSALLHLARGLSHDGVLGAPTELMVRRIPLFCGVLILAISTAFAVRDIFVEDLGRGLRLLARPGTARWGWGLFVGAAAIRLAWVLLVPSVPVSDFREYLDLASRLVGTGRYITAEGAPTAFRPPGYPVYVAFILLLTGGSITAVKLANVAMGAATCVLAWRLARTALPEGPARLAGLVVALFPSHVGYASLLASEVPFTALQTLALLLLAEAPRFHGRRSFLLAAGAGLALSAAAMMRPTVALLPGVFAVVLLARAGFGRGAALAAAFCVAFAPLPVAWGLRNASELGSFQPFSTNGGVNFHFGNNATTNGTGLEMLDPAVDATSGIADEVARNAAGWRLGAEYWRENPVASLRLAMRKVAWLLATDGVWTRWAMISADPQPSRAARGAVLAAANAAWLVLLLASVLELLLMRWRREARASAEPLGELMLLYTVAMAATFIGQERYHFPMVPAMAIAAACFAARFVPPTLRTSPTPRQT